MKRPSFQFRGKELNHEMDLRDISGTHPHAHEAVLENYPGQEKDEGLVAAVEG